MNMQNDSNFFCVDQCVVVFTNEILECSHMTSTNQSQPDAKFVTEEKEEEKEEKKEWLQFKAQMDRYGSTDLIVEQQFMQQAAAVMSVIADR